MLQSDIIYLSTITVDDKALFIDIYTDPEVMQHVGNTLNVQAALKLFNQCLNQFSKVKPSNRMYVIKSTKNNQKFGVIGLLWNQPEQDCVELGVMIAKPFVSKGYAYKATALLMDYGFVELKLKSIVVFCNETNVMANRVAKALGFVSNGRIADKHTKHNKIKWTALNRY